MPAAQNKQPLFTSVPILNSLTFDPQIPSSFNPYMGPTNTIYTDSSTNGTLITRITVTAAAMPGDRVTSKIIYLGIYNLTDSKSYLYTSKLMSGTGVLSSTDLPPYVEFTFGNGLVTAPGNQIVLQASTNNATTGDADQISVIVEGGTYDAA